MLSVNMAPPKNFVVRIQIQSSVWSDPTDKKF